MPGPRGGSATVRASSSVMTAIAEQAEVLAAELGRHVEQPQPELAGLGLERFADIRLEIRPVHAVHLDRDQLAIDEFADRVFENANLVRKVEIHPTYTCLGVHFRRARRRVSLFTRRAFVFIHANRIGVP